MIFSLNAINIKTYEALASLNINNIVDSCVIFVMIKNNGNVDAKNIIWIICITNDMFQLFDRNHSDLYPCLSIDNLKKDTLKKCIIFMTFFIFFFIRCEGIQILIEKEINGKIISFR